MPSLLNFQAQKSKKKRKEEQRRKQDMATNILSTANPFLLPSSSSSSSSSPSLSSATLTHVHHPIKCSVKRQLTLCKAVNQTALPTLTKRDLSISFFTSFLLSLAGKGCLDANAAILEADDDLELLEKVKKDRKKRLEKQGVISSSTKETGLVLQKSHFVL